MYKQFDRHINRYNTGSVKYDFLRENGYSTDTLPLWIADMDFAIAPPIEKALHQCVSQHIQGYNESKEAYKEAICNWFQKHFNWNIAYDWIVESPGVVYALCMAVQAYTSPGDSVLILSPIYPPFRNAITNNNRVIIEAPLIYQNGYYSMDIQALEDKIIENNIHLFLFCSPHNPTGRVWTRTELQALSELCIRHNIIVVSDEIHCDYVYKGFQHTILASLSHEILQQTVTCTSPSKTFNIAGLQDANIIIPNVLLRQKFIQRIKASGYMGINNFAIVGTETAYTQGEDWYHTCLEYLQSNRDYLISFFSEHLPDVHVCVPEGTFLVWLDFTGLNYSNEELDYLICEKAKVWLNHGSEFSQNCNQFRRINIACPKHTLRQALYRIAASLNQHK